MYKYLKENIRITKIYLLVAFAYDGDKGNFEGEKKKCREGVDCIIFDISLLFHLFGYI